jgi:hypothetical protein
VNKSERSQEENKMDVPTENARPVAQPELCPTCRLRRDNLQAAGVTIFMLSLCSFGTLTFIAIPIGVILQILAFRKCVTCRKALKKAKPKATLIDKGTEKQQTE